MENFDGVSTFCRYALQLLNVGINPLITSEHLYSWYMATIAKAKSSFLSNLVTESSTNPRTLWKTLNTILHRNPSNSFPESPDISSLANTFLDFFKDKIDRIRTKFLPSHSPDPFLFPPAPASKDDQFYSSHSHWNLQTHFCFWK